MFTGIIEAVGAVAGVAAQGDGLRLRVRVPEVLVALRPGESLAVDGACLTVVTVEREGDAAIVTADLGEETVRRTTLGHLERGRAVNLERALPAAARLDGHFVQGHVDDVAVIVRSVPEGTGRWMEIELPERLARFAAEKGSVAIDGVSLTIAGVRGRNIAVSLIPYTLGVTTLGGKGAGDTVNVEMDILAKYVARLLEGEAAVPEAS